MNLNTMQYEKILQETEELLNRKIQKSKKNQINKRSNFLNDFKENLILNKQRFIKMKNENEKTRNVIALQYL
jgi:hypothetical protein